jgi:exosortase
MVPLPHTIHGAVMLPLQSMSAQVATTVLETIGVPAIQSGNVLEVAEHQIVVTEACSGLRMALAFIIVTGVIAFVVDRPRWQRIAVLLSSVPIALACNVVRVVFSAYLFSVGQEWLSQGAFHDGAGLIMMPAAVGFVFFEFWLLSNLVVPSSAVAAIVEVCDDRVKRSAVVSDG